MLLGFEYKISGYANVPYTFFLLILPLAHSSSQLNFAEWAEDIEKARLKYGRIHSHLYRTNIQTLS